MTYETPLTTTELRRLVVETVIPGNYKWVARDQNGSVYVYEGQTMQVSPKTAVSASFLSEELGDWRDSCKEITELVGTDDN